MGECGCDLEVRRCSAHKDDNTVLVLDREERDALVYMAFGGEHPNHPGYVVRSIARKLGYAGLDGKAGG